MPFPEEQLRQEALLCLIYFRGRKGGSNYQLAPNETYEPLADYFRLSGPDRDRLEGDGLRSAWQINVQGTRERLAQQRYIHRPPPYRVWKLTEPGIRRAKTLAYRYIDLMLSSDLETPRAEDLNSPPELTPVLCQTYRMLRDTKLARKVKFLHEYQCQICGRTIQLHNGLRYAEAHHIKPLSSPHNGPDVAENIICVCPNHHVELDYGAIKLDGATLRGHVGLTIADEYVNYHNSRIFKGR